MFFRTCSGSARILERLALTSSTPMSLSVSLQISMVITAHQPGPSQTSGQSLEIQLRTGKWFTQPLFPRALFWMVSRSTFFTMLGRGGERPPWLVDSSPAEPDTDRLGVARQGNVRIDRGIDLITITKRGAFQSKKSLRPVKTACLAKRLDEKRSC